MMADGDGFGIKLGSDKAMRMEPYKTRKGDQNSLTLCHVIIFEGQSANQSVPFSSSLTRNRISVP